MPYGNARISAPEGQEVVELKLRVKPLTGVACCQASDFELQTVDGQKAESVWGEMTSSVATTFALQFIAPKGSRFKVFKVNGVVINVGALASEKSKP